MDLCGWIWSWSGSGTRGLRGLPAYGRFSHLVVQADSTRSNVCSTDFVGVLAGVLVLARLPRGMGLDGPIRSRRLARLLNPTWELLNIVAP